MFYEEKPPLTELMHVGMKGRSGRYRHGSGENPHQHCDDIIGRVTELRKQNVTFTDEDGNVLTGNTAIAKMLGFKSRTEFEVELSQARNKEKLRRIDTMNSLYARYPGISRNEVAKRMGVNESSLRSLEKQAEKIKNDKTRKYADHLKTLVDAKGMIDVGAGVELELGIPKTVLNKSLVLLEKEGYPTYGGRVANATNPKNKTTVKVLCPPGTKHREIFTEGFDKGKISSVKDYEVTEAGEVRKKGFVYPKSLSSKRISINYAEDGGIDKDGLVEIRPGVQDLSLGKSRYAQVRILVDDTHYIKGMAVYSDNLPEGVDLMFNTNKKKGTPMEKVLKEIKDDPENPFGSLIKENGQSYYTDKKGKEQLSLINKRAEEGDWDEWSNTLSSQFLSKQNLPLIKKQLNLAMSEKQQEFDEIMRLENPTVKKAMLKTFSEDCDSAAVHLKAAGLPRQRYQVIIPITSMKDTEVYAPNYKDGEKVALIRYPHGGIFEIPILTVNNKQADAKKMLGNAFDAVGINAKVAEQLSGADFDGDTVMVIPTRGNGKNEKVNIIAKEPLEELKGFDPKEAYPYREGMKVMSEKHKQTQMGIVSNLINDMTLKGANDKEIARAVKHSMVVIDAAKHKLDYKKSYEDNHIAELKKKWQGHIDEESGKERAGAATIISRAKSQAHPLKRVGQPKIDPETGKLIYKEVYEEYIDKRTGKVVVRTENSTRMAETDDARTLLSNGLAGGHPKEEAYAAYANKLKSLANQARKETLVTKDIPYSPQANAKYRSEVEAIDAALTIALKNAPRERMAQITAHSLIKAKKADNPDMTKEEIKKEKTRAINQARIKFGAQRRPIILDEKQWEAIQEGAIRPSKLKQVIEKMDKDNLRQLATPKEVKGLSGAQKARIKNMINSGFTTAQIAETMGVSTSTVRNEIKA